MIIRKQQISIFKGDQRERFHEALAAKLRVVFPDRLANVDNPALLGMIRDLHRRADAFEIKSQVAVGQFVVLGLFAGQGFHQRPAVQRFLRAPGMHGDQKIKLLINHVKASAEREG
jgi:hypothetical protein